ncbi:thiamine phosphate synthase [Pseudomaricurvus sp.]|uniref:thiamine phosphate synthase n=1 Tax=Pseudomaricurvus sp. TaxID=2004510 RepID=UPI003F6DA370
MMDQQNPTIAKPVVCAISASDSSGHAGHQCDLRVVQDLGAHGVSVISGLTAQNSQAVSHTQITSSESFTAQLASLKDDIPIEVIKVGLLFSADQVLKTAAFADAISGAVIVDPVLSSTSGTDFRSEELLHAYHTLIAASSLLTPNIPEAEKLLGITLKTHEDVIAAAVQLRRLGAQAVLIKGGHRQEHINDNGIYDYFDDGEHQFWLRQPRLSSAHTRGTGCALASAIASFLAVGKQMVDAVVLANAYIHQGIRSGFAIGQGAGLLGNGGWPSDFTLYPAVAESLDGFEQPAFASCDTQQLGIYPIVDSMEWLERLLKLGITTLQLRVKGLEQEPLNTLISQAVALGRQYDARLFINDHWKLAIEHQAYGVHLGQEDMDEAHLLTIQQSGLRLGLSSHSEYEWLRAANYKPSYIAMGSVFPTKTKSVHTIGLENLKTWSQILAPHFPLVAIGGITQEKLESVLQCGVGSVAVVSAIRTDHHFEQSVKQLQALFNETINTRSGY